MAIVATCGCGYRFQVRDDLAGKRFKCPKCGQPVQAPPAPAAVNPQSTTPQGQPAATPAGPPQSSSPGQPSPQQSPSRGAGARTPVLLVGCAAFAALAVLMFTACGLGAYFFIGRFAHWSGYANYSRYAISPLTAYKAHFRHLDDGDYAAAYYYYDADSREFLDALAREHGLSDGIELLSELYEPTYTGDRDRDFSADVAKKRLQTRLESQETAERLFNYTEEVKGNRGAVLARLPGDGPNSAAARTEMVRESGVWHYPMIAEDRSDMEYLVRIRFD
jgi:hypothetical protein